MKYSLSDIQALEAEAERAKGLTSNVLSSTSTQEIETHRDLCSDIKLQLSDLENSYDDDIEILRRDLADLRARKREVDQTRKEMGEHQRRCNNQFWTLRNSQPKL